ncbi:MAG: hypothetical protein M1823_002616 [Watsoniomyces obsoletus]|nr:MAG: hypothetical protein M1823_002616 [Watsoniomyces obsoletus]
MAHSDKGAAMAQLLDPASDVAAGRAIEGYEQGDSWPGSSSGSVGLTDGALLRVGSIEARGAAEKTPKSSVGCSWPTSGTTEPSANTRCHQGDRKGIARRSTDTPGDEKPSDGRGGGSGPKYSDEQLRAFDLTEEEIRRYRVGQKAKKPYRLALKLNKKAQATGDELPYSREAIDVHLAKLREYNRIRDLINAIESGDEARIDKARRAMEAGGYQPKKLTDAQLMEAFGDEAKVRHFKALRALNAKWKRVDTAARKAGRPLKNEKLTKAQRRLKAAAADYKHLSYVMGQPLEKSLAKPVERGVPKATDEEQKRLLDLVSIADYNKGKRLGAAYSAESIRRRRRRAKPGGAELAGTSPDTSPEMSEAEFSRLLEGRKLYKDMLEVLRLAREEESKAPPGTKGPFTSDSTRLGEEHRLFTPEEEKYAKKLFSVQVIEEYVEGRRAVRELERAEAAINAAPPDRRDHVAGQWNLEELQRQANRYRELHREVEKEQEPWRNQSRDARGRSLPKSTVVEQPPTGGETVPEHGTDAGQYVDPLQAGVQEGGNDGGQQVDPLRAKVFRPEDNGVRASTSQQEHIWGQYPSGQRVQKLPNHPSAAHPPPLLTRPSVYADKVRAGWKGLGGQLQDTLRANGQSSSVRPEDLIPKIGAAVGNAFRAPSRVAIHLRV